MQRSADLFVRNIGIFWDYENIFVNKTTADVRATINRIQSSVIEHHPVKVTHKTLYYDPKKALSQLMPKDEFHSAGYALNDCPTRWKKEFVDKKMLIDLMKFYIDHGSNTTIVLISSDGDFDYCLSILRDYGVKVVVIQNGNTNVLKDCCDTTILWEDVLVKKVTVPSKVDKEPSSSSSSFSASSSSSLARNDGYDVLGTGTGTGTTTRTLRNSSSSRTPFQSLVDQPALHTNQPPPAPIVLVPPLPPVPVVLEPGPKQDLEGFRRDIVYIKKFDQRLVGGKDLQRCFESVPGVLRVVTVDIQPADWGDRMSAFAWVYIDCDPEHHILDLMARGRWLRRQTGSTAIDWTYAVGQKVPILSKKKTIYLTCCGVPHEAGLGDPRPPETKPMPIYATPYVSSSYASSSTIAEVNADLVTAAVNASLGEIHGKENLNWAESVATTTATASTGDSTVVSSDDESLTPVATRHSLVLGPQSMPKSVPAPAPAPDPKPSYLNLAIGRKRSRIDS